MNNGAKKTVSADTNPTDAPEILSLLNFGNGLGFTVEFQLVS